MESMIKCPQCHNDKIFEFEQKDNSLRIVCPRCLYEITVNMEYYDNGNLTNECYFRLE